MLQISNHYPLEVKMFEGSLNLNCNFQKGWVVLWEVLGDTKPDTILNTDTYTQWGFHHVFIADFFLQSQIKIICIKYTTNGKIASEIKEPL